MHRRTTQLPLTRRALLKRAAMLAAVGAGPLATAIRTSSGGAVADPKDPMPIIDTHQHLWDLDKFRLPWVKEGQPLARSFLTSDYDEATRGLNVVQTVYMEVAVDPAQHDEEVAYVSEICRRADTPMRAAVISGRPAGENFAKYLARHKNNPYVRGMRQVLHEPETPRGYCLKPEFVRGVRLLGEQGWSFDLCMRSDELADGAALIDQCPDTRFVLDHCGNASVVADDLSGWRKDMAAIAKRPNVIGKVSGIIASGEGGRWNLENLAPIINHTLEVFGPDRVVFGGDWPVCTLAATFRQWVEALKAIVADRGEVEQRKLFAGNAMAFYRLES